jgi:hypothetical protein
MPANDFDHRSFASDNTSDIGYAIATAMLAANPPLDLSAPGGLTYAYGAGAGTTPTAFTTQAQFAPGSNALRGAVYFNTGSATPAGGLVLTVTLPVALPIANLNNAVGPYIFLNPRGISIATTQASAAFGFAAYPIMTSTNLTGFAIYTSSTLTASQGSATAAAFGVEFWIIP